MRYIKSTLLVALLFTASLVQAQMARVQAIHNCPDPAAATVDVYLNNTLLLDDFNYQDASPYIDAPAGVAFDISICAPNSVDTTGAIFRKSFTLPMNSTNVVVASGGLAETGNTAFDLRAYVGQEQATNQSANEISLNVIHGSYDAPMVDIFEVQIPAGELVPDISFGDDVGSYVNLSATDYDIQVRTQTGIVAAEFDVDVTTLADSAAIVMATGYLDPGSAVGTEPFGLLAILPNGTVINLPAKAITPARLQVIHNCAAVDASTVDVWLNDGPMPLLDDFEFRTASPFIDAPGGTPFDVSIALPNSTDTTAALFRQSFQLESGKTYIVIASGTIGSGTYSPATAFSLEAIAGAREAAANSADVDVYVWHGATDAPTVDVIETQVGAGTIVDDLSYGNGAGYLSLTPADYDLDIADMTGNTTLFTYDADLSTFGGSALTVLASGFVDPSMNNSGEAFGLWVATAAGGNLIPLSIITGVKEQALANELNVFPNPAAESISIQFESETAQKLRYDVMSLDGRILSSQDVRAIAGNNLYKVGLSDLTPGYYMVRISSDKATQTVAFVKQ